MKLYLARIELITSRYMGGGTTRSEIMRLVRAPSEEEACLLIEKRLERPDPYGDNTRVSVLELSETIEAD